MNILVAYCLLVSAVVYAFVTSKYVVVVETFNVSINVIGILPSPEVDTDTNPDIPIPNEYFWGNDLSGTEQGAGGVGGLLAVSIDGAFFIPCYDHNGNIVCYVSESGTIAAQCVYDPYGNVIEQYGALASRFAIRFSTKYTDVETGLISYLRRFYCPDHGRWLNRDPIEEDGGENLYAFCENSPLVYVDAFGFQIVVIRHLVGKSPPGGWGDGGRNRGQTHYKEPDISCKEVKKGKGKIGFAVSIDPPITIINVYFREDEGLDVTSNNENQHIALYIILDNAIEKFKRVAEDIVECPDEAYRLLDIAHNNLQKVRVYVAAENNRLDAPGGPHGH